MNTRIDVSELIHDPDFCEDFVIYRRTRVAGNDGRAIVTETVEPIAGIIQPLTGDELDRLPEGDRGKEIITVWTLEELTIGYGSDKPDEPSRLPDDVEWKGTRYTVAPEMKNWGQWGNGYYRAICISKKMRSAP